MVLQIISLLALIIIVGHSIQIFKKAVGSPWINLELAVAALILVIFVPLLDRTVPLPGWLLASLVCGVFILAWSMGRIWAKKKAPKSPAPQIIRDLKSLAQSLSEQKKTLACQQLRDGLGLVNGLTDGWAALLESVNHCINNQLKYQLSPLDVTRLIYLRKSIEGILNR